jgi:hypothetical protein
MTARLLSASALVLAVSNPALFSQAQTSSKERCRPPIQYRIGAVDPRFGITREDFGRAVEEASQLWESAAGRTLFTRNARGALKVNLVYDSRQETTQRVIAARASISEKLKEADRINDRLRPLQNTLDDLNDAYSGQLASYQRLQDDHNKRVEQWNGKGGAPEAEYHRLLGERLSLRKQAETLQAKRKDLNRLTDDINQQIDRHNTLLRRANMEANALSASGATGVAFEEGLYARRAGDEQIAIFQYDGAAALRVILSHELGHALGIRHNANPSSIMSALIHTDRLALTDEDLEGLRAACPMRQ